MTEKTKEYSGAKFVGTHAVKSPKYGMIEPGKIYPIPEAQAIATSGFEPVYGGDKKKEGKVK